MTIDQNSRECIAEALIENPEIRKNIIGKMYNSYRDIARQAIYKSNIEQEIKEYLEELVDAKTEDVELMESLEFNYEELVKQLVIRSN